MSSIKQALLTSTNMHTKTMCSTESRSNRKLLSLLYLLKQDPFLNSPMQIYNKLKPSSLAIQHNNNGKI